MAVMFLYPPGCELIEDAPMEEGWIRMIQIDRQPYEISVEFRGFSYHVIFGSQCNGNFLCIPWPGIGAGLADLNDLAWNTESLKKCGLAADMAEMFAQCMSEVQYYLKE